MDHDDGGHEADVGVSAARMTPKESSFVDVYRRYHGRICRTLSCLGVPEAALEDAVQDVFVVVFRRLGDPDRYDSMRSWLYAVARRVAWRHHRTDARGRRKIEAVRREPPGSVDDPEENAAQREAASLMKAFLAELDIDQRTVFVLADIEGLTAPQIASVVEAKVPTVYSRLRLARARFARLVKRHGARARREVADAD